MLLRIDRSFSPSQPTVIDARKNKDESDYFSMFGNLTVSDSAGSLGALVRVSDPPGSESFFMDTNTLVDTTAQLGGFNLSLAWDNEDQLDLRSGCTVERDTGNFIVSARQNDQSDYFSLVGNLTADTHTQKGSSSMALSWDDALQLTIDSEVSVNGDKGTGHLTAKAPEAAYVCDDGRCVPAQHGTTLHGCQAICRRDGDGDAPTALAVFDPPSAHGMALHQFYLDAQATVDTSSAGGGSLTSTLGWDGEQQLDLTTTVDVKGDMGTLGE